ncbi:MAG: hypothetical protein J2P49_08460, partial [Methylocapsa sp.]|nr:hypothetical protein [Methylocapsa sp.]
MVARRLFMVIGFAAGAVFSSTILPTGSSAQDVRHECSQKYQAAKAAGTLGEATWPQFYSRCVAEIKGSTPAAAPTAAEAAPLDV